MGMMNSNTYLHIIIELLNILQLFSSPLEAFCELKLSNRILLFRKPITTNTMNPNTRSNTGFFCKNRIWICCLLIGQIRRKKKVSLQSGKTQLIFLSFWKHWISLQLELKFTVYNQQKICKLNRKLFSMHNKSLKGYTMLKKLCKACLGLQKWFICF